jgi:predicted Zn-dependent peptidase
MEPTRMPARATARPKHWRPITAEDLKASHTAMFARDNLHVGVVGAIDAETLKGLLDKVFGDLPEKARLTPVPRRAAQARPDGSRSVRAA